MNSSGRKLWTQWARSPDPRAQLSRQMRRQRMEIEAEEQAAFIERFGEHWPQHVDVLIHIPNGGSRANAFEGWRLKRQGVKPGVSDLMLPVPSAGYHGLWIEFKAAPPNDAAVSAPQARWIKLMQQYGYWAQVCRGVDEAMATVKSYLQS